MPTIEHYTGPTRGSDCGRSNVYSSRRLSHRALADDLCVVKDAEENQFRQTQDVVRVFNGLTYLELTPVEATWFAQKRSDILRCYDRGNFVRHLETWRQGDTVSVLHVVRSSSDSFETQYMQVSHIVYEQIIRFINE